MTSTPPISIAVISDNPDPDWVWLRDLMGEDFAVGGRGLHWTGFSTAPERTSRTAAGQKIARRLKSLSRWRGAGALKAAAAKDPFDLIVSHGPLATAWTARVIGPAGSGARHLAFSFNFTDLPTGLRRTLMARAFKTVDAFAVFTNAEQGLYADYFTLDPNRVLRAPWGVAPPLTAETPREIEGPYVAALGGEARDYETLCETARLCPDVRFAAVARPHNFDGLDPPENLSVRFNLPFEEAWGIVQHADAALIPLRSRETPCGLVTLVGGMHLGKAQIATDAVGVGDYIVPEETGLLTPPRDAGAMAAAVRRLQGDPALADRLGRAAKAYAAAHCSEAATVGFFSDLLRRWFG